MSQRWTLADVRAIESRRAAAAPIARQKFGNHSVTIDGIAFDSKKEGERYLFLKMRERRKEITGLEVQPLFPIFIDPFDGRPRVYIGEYHADFRYWEPLPGGGEALRVEDVKSKATKTEAYQRTKKLVEAIHGVTITEI